MSAEGRGIFFAVMAAGILASGMIGVGSRNQMEAASTGIPVMQVFSLLPMLSMFHDGVAKVAGFTYSDQVRILVAGLLDGAAGQDVRAWAVIFGNILEAGDCLG